MPYTTTELITGAYYASGLVARRFETVSGSQIGDGLLWLNDIITEKTVDEAMIPYETTYTFNAVQGQQIYFIENLIRIDTLAFFKNQVRYSMQFQKRNQYFGTDRVENIESLPYAWYFEKQFEGGNLYIYFLPDQGYPFEVHGIFRLSEVTLGQDLSLTLERFYITYLRYALAERICAENQYDVPVYVEKELEKYQAFIAKRSRVLDLRMKKLSTLQNRITNNYAYINLGHGFTP